MKPHERELMAQAQILEHLVTLTHDARMRIARYVNDWAQNYSEPADVSDDTPRKTGRLDPYKLAK